MPFDIHPDLTIEELVLIKELKEECERFAAEQEAELETQQFAYQFEWNKIKESYDEFIRESNKRKEVMRRLVMARQNPEQVLPIDNPSEYIIPECRAMDRIDLMEVLSERQQAVITKQREELQKFREKSQQELQDTDKKIAIILRNFPEALHYLDGMQYTVIDIPIDSNQHK